MSNILNRYLSINKDTPMTPKTLEYRHLERILPQAYPFLLIDRVVDIQEGQSLTAIKNITANEWPCGCGRATQHYPETLLIEAAAQAALVLYHVSKVKEGDPRPRYAIGKVTGEFFEQAICGDTVALNTFARKMMDDFGYMDIDLGCGANQKLGAVQLFYSVIK